MAGRRAAKNNLEMIEATNSPDEDSVQMSIEDDVEVDLSDKELLLQEHSQDDEEESRTHSDSS